MNFVRLLILLCAFTGIEAKTHKKMKVVATFSILGDLVKAVGRDRIVISIVGPNSDAHVYEPTPTDVKEIASADVVFTNGLGFEGWIDRLIEGSGYKGPVATASKGVKPLTISDPNEGIVLDPHAWHDPRNVEIYINNIARTLTTADPRHAAQFHENAKEYILKLKTLHKKLQTLYDAVPRTKRKVITAHDGFSYHGQCYGIEFKAPIGITTAAEPSPKEMANLIDLIKAENIAMIFVENITNPGLIRQLSDETGVKIGKTVYSDALSAKNEPGSTYLKMMEHNARQFYESFKSQATHEKV